MARDSAASFLHNPIGRLDHTPHTVAHPVSSEGEEIVIVRMYLGEDGHTHSEDLQLPAPEVQNGTIQTGANIVFRRVPVDYCSDWHTAPQ